VRRQLVHIASTVLLNKLGGVDINLLVRVDRNNHIPNEGLRGREDEEKEKDTNKES